MRWQAACRDCGQGNDNACWRVDLPSRVPQT